MTAIAALVEQHRHDDHRPGNRHLPEGRDADHRQGVINDPEEQRAAQAAQHPSASAHGADTADHAGGDHLEFKTVGDVDIGDGEARDPQIAAEAGQRAGETEADELHFSGVNAGVVCRRRVAARGV